MTRVKTHPGPGTADRAGSDWRKPTLDERLEDLERSGSLVRSALPRRTFGPVERRLGALSRFLAERGE